MDLQIDYVFCILCLCSVNNIILKNRSHVLLVAHRIQGGAGPGGCDAGHWKDVLLRYGGHSSRLRDAVATLARRLLNNIIPWDSIRALVANRLIALDKCPGVRPIGIGETLRRIIGKVVCLATRIDAELVYYP